MIDVMARSFEKDHQRVVPLWIHIFDYPHLKEVDILCNRIAIIVKRQIVTEGLQRTKDDNRNKPSNLQYLETLQRQELAALTGLNPN